MLLKRRPVRCSPPALLERLWKRKRTTFNLLASDFPGTAEAVLRRGLACLYAAGLANRHRSTKLPVTGGLAHYWWKPTRRGIATLAYLHPYRDWWDVIQLRELRAIAAAELTFERLERIRRSMNPWDREKPRRFFLRDRDPDGPLDGRAFRGPTVWGG